MTLNDILDKINGFDSKKLLDLINNPPDFVEFCNDQTISVDFDQICDETPDDIIKKRKRELDDNLSSLFNQPPDNILDTDLTECQKQCFDEIQKLISDSKNITDMVDFYNQTRSLYRYLCQISISISLLSTNGTNDNTIIRLVNNIKSKFDQYPNEFKIILEPYFVELLSYVKIGIVPDNIFSSLPDELIQKIKLLLPANYNILNVALLDKGESDFDYNVASPIYQNFIDSMSNNEINNQLLKEFYNDKKKSFDEYLLQVINSCSNISSLIFESNLNISINISWLNEFNDFVEDYLILYQEFSELTSFSFIDSYSFNCCGDQLKLDDFLNSATTDIEEDQTFNTIPDLGVPEITDLSYWIKYSSFLNIINLLPTYWSRGLPSPSGFLPFPTIWIPILVIPLNGTLYVIFITINGIIVSPVIWKLDMSSGISVSSFDQILRGSNIKIKDNTISKANNVIVDGIDINPIKSLDSIFVQDDLPTYNRLTINNAPFISYLNQWLSVSAPNLGA